MKFSDVNWGSDDAKGDDKLIDYFFKFSKFDKIKDGSYRYIIGRKGAGKTAVIERIKQELENNATAFCSGLTLRDFPLQDLRNFRDKSYRDKSQFVSIWQFLIYVELSKLVLKDLNIESSEGAQELRIFLEKNNLNNGLGFSETIKELKAANSKINILSKWLGGEVGKLESSEQFSTIHYNKVVKVLEKKLASLGTSCEFWIFIDELDEGFRAGDTNFRLLLLALLRAVEDTSLSLNGSLSFRPLLVLRSDIFDSLEDNDLNKLDDYLIRLRWSSEDFGSNNSYSDVYALKEVILARINNTISGYHNNYNSWGKIVEDTNNKLPEGTKSVWKYMANRTYERPRDIIKFLKICSEVFEDNKYKNKLSFEEVKRAELRYSNWLFNELRDEIHAHLPCWKEVLQCLAHIGKGKFGKSVLDDALRKNREIQKWLENENKDNNYIIELLFDFGIVGNLDRGRWLFKYKDEDLRWNENMDLIVHFGLHKKLRITYKE